MSGKIHNAWFILGATVVGLVGAVSMVIIEKIKQRREQQAMAQRLAWLDTEMQTMRKELEQLRNLQKNVTSKKSRRSKLTSTSTTSTDDYVSATDADSSDLEFYDVSDDEIQISNETDSLERILSEIDTVLDAGKTQEVIAMLERLRDLCSEFPEESRILWRLGRALHKLANYTNNINEKREYLTEGIKACETALRITPNIPEVHKWYALLIGARAEIQSLRGQINDGNLFKKHLDEALKLNPKDSILHHMMGRYAYEIASLKWFQRKAASAFVAEPPNATYQDALDHFLKVEQYCSRPWKENKLFIAKCHMAMDQPMEAVKWLEDAKTVENKDDADAKVHSEIINLLTKYNNCR